MNEDELQVRFFIARDHDNIPKAVRPGGLYFAKDINALYFGDEENNAQMIHSHNHTNLKMLESLGNESLPMKEDGTYMTLREFFDYAKDKIESIERELATKQKQLVSIDGGGVILNDKGDFVEISVLVSDIPNDIIDEICDK